MIIYVDDTIITNNDAEEIQILQENMTAKFEIKNPEGIKYFLGRLARDSIRNTTMENGKRGAEWM